MPLIKIYASGVELDYIDDTLSIKVSQELLSDDIKIDGSEYPFLIIENQSTENALGSASAFLSNRKQYFPITVVNATGMYMGELQVIECFDYYRKCNVRFYPQIYQLSQTKIRDFFPTVSVIPGEVNPIPYSNKSIGLLAGAEWWTPYVDGFKNKKFPQVNWQFPTISYPTKFGEVKEGSDWETYRNHLNLKDEWGIIPNTHVWTAGGLLIHNLNVPVVCPYLLAPLSLAVESIGLGYSGNILNDEFLKSIVFIPKEDNLVQITQATAPTSIDLLSQPFTPNNDFFYKFQKAVAFTVYERGEYQVEFDIEERANFSRMYVVVPNVGIQELFEHDDLGNTTNQKTGSARFFIKELVNNSAQIGVLYLAARAVNPKINSLTFSQTMKKDGYQMHPTIEVGRYVPDWTFGEYLNEMRKLFNLDFVFNEYTNSLEVNFLDQVIQNKSPVQLQSYKMKSYQNSGHEDIVFSYDNTIDQQLKRTINSSELGYFPERDKTKLLRNKFKKLDYKNYSIELTKNDEEKSGIGLGLYDPTKSVFCIENINGKSLELSNIVENHFKLTIENYIEGSIFTVEQKVSQYELLRIQENRFVVIDHLVYYVNTIEYKKKSSLIYIKMELFLISF